MITLNWGFVNMYVCICHAVTDNQIREAVHHGGIQDFDDLSEKLKVATCCGRCADCAHKVLNQALGEYSCCLNTAQSH